MPRIPWQHFLFQEDPALLGLPSPKAAKTLNPIENPRPSDQAPVSGGLDATDPPREEFFLPEEDVRAIVRLLGGVIAMRGDINRCRRHLMDGLCPLVGADYWLWCVADLEPGKGLSHSGILHGGFDDERFSWFLQAINHPSLGKVNHRIGTELFERGCHITRNLSQVEDPEKPLFSTEAKPFWEKADIGTLMLSLRPMETGGATGIGLYRKIGRPDFTEREIRIAHIILTEVS